MIASLVLATALALQAVQQPPRDSATRRLTIAIPGPNDTSVIATRAERPPVIDGKGDDDVWRIAPTISDFKEWRPTENKPARFRTEAKVAYDAANLYLFVRAFDPHPDSIIKLLERRDSYTPSDMVWLFVDSYHDRRTGYEFGVNAAGVKIDLALYDDGNEDDAWDAVWDAATRIDSLGWTAEFRIPLSQMRYSGGKSHTFGLMIDRDVYRLNERYAWPLLLNSKPGFVSQFGALAGLDGLESPKRLEVMPYAVTKSASTIVNNRFAQKQSISVGGDVKYRIAPNLTLDATVNPDFGQVESDPAVLNLSAYESFFDERRPFFVAGRGLFRFDVNCSQVNCSSEGLYYSRRIGRTPELAGVYGDTIPLQPVTILGAAKLLGRFPGGLTFGVLDAATERATGRDTTYDPATNFALFRATQDFRGGNSAVGAILTAVNRNLDHWSTPYLPSSAYVAAMDFRHRFFKNAYYVNGSLDNSRVQGSPSAILGLQRNAVHNFQRPDSHLGLDSSRTALAGDAEEFKVGKASGQHFLFELAVQRQSPGFETNDMGFLRRADQTSWGMWTGFFDRRTHLFYNRFQWNNNWWQEWTARGMPLERAYNTNTHITFKNNLEFHMGGTIGQLGSTFDDRAARGGPAVRQDSYLAPWVRFGGDDRKPVVPSFNINAFRGAGGRNTDLRYGPEVIIKLLGRFSSGLGLNFDHNVRDNQFFGQFTSAGVTHYTFAHLDQTTTSMSVRLNYTFTPNVSLQTYAQPFVSKGTYSNVRELSANPRALAYDDRYAAYADPVVTANPGGFNFKQLASNVVFRWEYQPGSTLFVVWNQGRQGFAPQAGDKNFRNDVNDLFSLHPANTFLVKIAYWLNR